MKIALVAAVLMSTASASFAASNIEPIPGSITFGGQPHQKLTKSPVGSQLPQDFVNNFG